MFTEDYVLRMINQVLAALMTILKLKKAGDHQAVQQAPLTKPSNNSLV